MSLGTDAAPGAARHQAVLKHPQGDAVGEVVGIRHHAALEVVQVDIAFKGRWPGHEAGQFAFVTLHEHEGPHPYTISSAWRNDGRVTFIIKALGNSAQVEATTKTALGIAVLIAAFGLVARAYIRLVERARVRDGKLPPLPTGRPEVTVRKVPTILLGVFGGVIVGMTSVGSGSLIIIALMLLYPALKASNLVGTDLVQAVPLVASAALAHILFGDFQMSLTASLLIGSIPGVFIGAQLSSRAPGGIVRRALAFVLLASSLKLLGVSNQITGVLLVTALVVAPLLWMAVRRRHGFPALAQRRPKDSLPKVDSAAS